MSTKQDGGPAFPAEHGLSKSGMSLRDWFAGQALAGMCAYSGRAAGEDVLGTVRDRATNAYAHADAMLAERSKP